MREREKERLHISTYDDILEQKKRKKERESITPARHRARQCCRGTTVSEGKVEAPPAAGARVPSTWETTRVSYGGHCVAPPADPTLFVVSRGTYPTRHIPSDRYRNLLPALSSSTPLSHTLYLPHYLTLTRQLPKQTGNNWGGASARLSVTSGVPQGSLLGTIFFLLPTSKIWRRVNGEASRSADVVQFWSPNLIKDEEN